MSTPSGIKEWLQNLPIGWLTGRTWGRAEVTSYGSVLDDQVTKVADAVKARMPSKCNADALPYIGIDRKLLQGKSSDADYRTRLLSAWDDWALAGTAAELLAQLEFNGFEGATIVQQNGLIWFLDGPIAAGADPLGQVVVEDLSPLATDLPPIAPYARTIPAGTPWWRFDDKTDFCSRFAVIFAGPRYPSCINQIARVSFTASATGTATWPNGPFNDTTYLTQVGVPSVVSGGPVVINAVASSKTRSSIDVTASASFTGTVDVNAWNVGDNPFANFLPGDLGRLRSVIETWKPAKSTCVGIIAIAYNLAWGFPEWNGASTVTREWGGGWIWGGETATWTL